MRISELATPALLLDRDALEENFRQMDRLLADSPMKLYPHYKSHKCPALARMQLARGAGGITCAKLSEAEDLAAAGVPAVVIANQVVQAEKLPRLAELAGRCDLTVCVDSAENVLALEGAMGRTGGRLRVLVEYEVGMRRCGVETPEAFLDLARLIDAQPHLLFEGIQAYAGQLSHRRDAAGRRAELLEIEAEVRRLKAFVEAAGLPVRQVCGGSTGTAADKPRDTVYTQLQTGSYLLMDATYQTLGLRFQPALFLLTTVLSVKEDRVVVDAGVKSLTMDQNPPVFPDFPDATLLFSEEHTTLLVRGSGLRPGDRLRCLPGHCCTTVNVHDCLYLTEGQEVLEVLPVVSRGRAQ